VHSSDTSCLLDTTTASSSLMAPFQ